MEIFKAAETCCGKENVLTSVVLRVVAKDVSVCRGHYDIITALLLHELFNIWNLKNQKNIEEDKLNSIPVHVNRHYLDLITTVTKNTQ